MAARNVLIAEGFLLKIGDFGLSRDLNQGGKDYYRKITPVRSLYTDFHKLRGRFLANFYVCTVYDATDIHCYIVYVLPFGNKEYCLLGQNTSQVDGSGVTGGKEAHLKK